MGLKDIGDIDSMEFRNEVRRIMAVYNRMGMDTQDMVDSLIKISRNIEDDGIETVVDNIE